jgi:hypothetical protein
MPDEEILDTPEDLSVLETAGTEGGKPSEAPTPTQPTETPTPQSAEVKKQTQPGSEAPPLLLEIKASIDKLAGQVEKLVSEMEKARKPQKYPYPEKAEKKPEEEEEEEEKAGKKPEEYPYPEEEEKAKKPKEYPEPEKARKPKYPMPPTRKGEVLAISEEDLTKMIEDKAAEIAEKKVTEILQKSLGKTEKRGEVPDIGGPGLLSGPQALLKAPLAKIGTMPRAEFLSQLRGGK